jgi:hypothetical protein
VANPWDDYRPAAPAASTVGPWSDYGNVRGTPEQQAQLAKNDKIIAARQQSPDAGFWSVAGEALKNGPKALMDFISGHPLAEYDAKLNANAHEAQQLREQGRPVEGTARLVSGFLPGSGDEAVAAGEEFGAGHPRAGAAHAVMALLPFAAEGVPRVVDAAADTSRMALETARGAATGTADFVGGAAASQLTRDVAASIPGVGPIANKWVLKPVAKLQKGAKALEAEAAEASPEATVRGITYPNGDYPKIGETAPAPKATGGKPAPVLPDDYSPPRDAVGPWSDYQPAEPVPVQGQPQHRPAPQGDWPANRPAVTVENYPAPRQPVPPGPNVAPEPPAPQGQPQHLPAPQGDWPPNPPGSPASSAEGVITASDVARLTPKQFAKLPIKEQQAAQATADALNRSIAANGTAAAPPAPGLQPPAAEAETAPQTESPRSQYTASGERKSPQLRGEEKHAYNIAQKEDRFAATLDKLSPTGTEIPWERIAANDLSPDEWAFYTGKVGPKEVPPNESILGIAAKLKKLQAPKRAKALADMMAEPK